MTIGADLVGAWNLLTIDGDAVEGAMRPPHLEFGADGRVSGSGGVNRIIGSFALDGSTLDLGQLGSTMMAGPPEAMALEQRVHAALAGPLDADIDGDALTLRGRDHVLTFERQRDAG